MCILTLRTQLTKLNNFATRYCICRICLTQQEVVGNGEHLLNSMYQIPSAQIVHELHDDLQKLLISRNSIKKTPIYYSGAPKGKKKFWNSLQFFSFSGCKRSLGCRHFQQKACQSQTSSTRKLSLKDQIQIWDYHCIFRALQNH